MLKVLCTIIAISLTLCNGNSDKSKLFKQLDDIQRGLSGVGDQISEMHSKETSAYQLLQAVVNQINSNAPNEELRGEFHILVSEANKKLDALKTNLTTGIKESHEQESELLQQIFNETVSRMKSMSMAPELQKIKTTLNNIEVKLEQLHTKLNKTNYIEARLKNIEEFGLTPTKDHSEQINLLNEVLSKLKSQDEKMLRIEESASKLDKLSNLLDTLKNTRTKESTNVIDKDLLLQLGLIASNDTEGRKNK